jgi:putative spermidine/putrescine transport system permease protein
MIPAFGGMKRRILWMADTALGAAGMVADDGTPLRVKLARTTRRNKLRALLLVAPLGLFILASFLYPLALMLARSFYAPEFGQILHRTAAAIAPWDGNDLPDEAVFQAFVEDIKQARDEQTLGRAATRLNFELSGTRSLMMKTGRNADTAAAPYKEALLAIDPQWSKPELWHGIRRLSRPVGAGFYLNALDRRYVGDFRIVAQPQDQQIYVTLFLRTLFVSGAVTLMCLVLGYPVAYLLSTLPMRISNLLMILVLLPFWTSLLVRTTTWIALLQSKGIVNDLLVWAGIVGDDNRLELMFNMTGTVIAMTHILLPFMILPLYSVMKTIPPSYMRAAVSLGAHPFLAFWRVYAPQTLPGVGAGGILCFILAIGYYITPALVGGQSGQLISNIIAYHMQTSLNWSLAAALASLLLVGISVLYWLYNRVVGAENVKLG